MMAQPAESRTNRLGLPPEPGLDPGSGAGVTPAFAGAGGAVQCEASAGDVCMR